MNKLPIISAEERLNQKRGIKGCIFGKSGIGKTSLLWTLDPRSSLFVDLEAGDLAIEGWEGDCVRPKTWPEFRDFTVFIGGPNQALSQTCVYSQAHYEAVCKQFGNPYSLDKYETIFIDSMTVAGRLCFQWCKGQPQSFSDKNGKPDIRGTYGLQGQEMLGWLTHLQHIREKNIWFLGILDEKADEFGRRFYTPQIEGSKTGLELPGIVDQVITMAEVSDGERPPYRAFINHTINSYGYPAKDRSGRLNMMEEPHLGKLMEKIKSPLQARNQQLIYTTNINNNNETKGE